MNNKVNISSHFNNTTSTNKILIVIMTAIILFVVFYLAFNVNKNYLANSKYQTLISPYMEIDQQTESISKYVHGSANGTELSFSFWLKVSNFRPNRRNLSNPLNILFGLSNNIYVGIDKQTNTLSVIVKGHNGNTVVELENIPFYTWTQYIITVTHQYISIYHNGQLLKTELLTSGPLISHMYNVFTNVEKNDPMFKAEIANLYYIGKTLSKKDIEILSQQIPKIPKESK
jgi:hypothetical protein